MTVTGWRIFKPKNAATAFAGEGARLFGGRWNSKGTAIVYTAGSAALAALEMLVHLTSHQILETYLLAPVTFGNDLVRDIDPDQLPADWRSNPPPVELKELGDRWAAEQTSAVLRVSSALLEIEPNYLLNPAHPDFSRIVIGKSRPFTFDSRLAR